MSFSFEYIPGKRLGILQTNHRIKSKIYFACTFGEVSYRIEEKFKSSKKSNPFSSIVFFSQDKIG